MPFFVLQSSEEFAEQFGAARTVLSVGTFDGLHLGHQRILQSVVARARTEEQTALVVTFDPHPLRVLRPEQSPQMIQTLSQRLAGFERMGLDAAVVLRFDRALSLVSAEEFIREILLGRLHVGTIMVGENFRFGHRGAGDVRLLSEYGRSLGFGVEVVPPVEIQGRIVSSTAVRQAITTGNVADAISFLGRPFSLTGVIRPGAGRGRTILFPTLNLEKEQELEPKLGVYATESLVEGNVYPSVTNVGTRPTFNGQRVTVESYLFGFDQQITDGPMEVSFHARIRDEKKFSGPEALKAQIACDIEAAKQYFSEQGIPEHSPSK